MTNEKLCREVIEFAREFLVESQHIADGSLNDGEPLFSAGTLSSIALVELVLKLEERFGISISARDVSVDNFDSLEIIARYVAARLTEEAG